MAKSFNECWYKEVCLADECTDRCIKFREMNYLMQHSGIPEKKQRPIQLVCPEVDIDAYNRLADIKRHIVDFVNDGQNLYIGSNVTGNGKTSWSLKLLMKYFDKIWSGNGMRTRGLFVYVPIFLAKCKDFRNQDENYDEYLYLIDNCDLVVWDDIGSSDLSTYDYQQLLRHLDTRQMNGLSNIYTGNLETKESISKVLGDKISSRILSKDTEVIILRGDDVR